MAAKRAAWQAAQPGFDVTKLIFIDETWVKTNMVRLHGWAPRGERLVDKTAHGHWKTSTFLAGLRHDGVIAPGVFDGAINGALFLAWVEQGRGHRAAGSANCSVAPSSVAARAVSAKGRNARAGRPVMLHNRPANSAAPIASP